MFRAPAGEGELLFSPKQLRKLIIPLIIEQLLAVTIGLADTVMVSSAGEAAVSGVSLVDQVNVLLQQVFSALATGGAVVISQLIGARQKEKATDTARQLYLLTLLVGTAIGVLCIVFNGLMLNTVFGKIESDVMETCVAYFYVSAASYPFLSVYNAGTAVFRSQRRSSVTMAVSIVMNVVNVIGNTILIYVFDLEALGAGIASLVARFLGAVIMVMLSVKKNAYFRIEKIYRIHFDWQTVKRILHIGIPNGIENGMFQVGKLILASLISTLSTVAIAANAVSNTISSFAVVPGMAIGLGIVTVVGQCMGAEKPKQAMYYSKQLIFWAYLLMDVILLLILVLKRPMLGLFNLSEETVLEAEEIIGMYCIVSIPLWTPAFTVPNTLRAAGDVRYTMIVSMVSMWLFRVVTSYILVLQFNMGANAVWIAMYCDWVCRIAFFVPRFLRGKWQNIRLLNKK